MLAAPKTPQTLDFIDYRGACPQSYRVTGTWERVMGMLAEKIFAPAFRAPPPAPPRPSARVGERGEQSLFPFALPNGLEPVSPEVLLAAKKIAFWLCKCPCLRQTMCNAVHRANQICYLRQARMNWQGFCDANILKSSFQRLVYQRKGRNRQTRQ